LVTLKIFSFLLRCKDYPKSCVWTESSFVGVKLSLLNRLFTSRLAKGGLNPINRYLLIKHDKLRHKSFETNHKPKQVNKDPFVNKLKKANNAGEKCKSFSTHPSSLALDPGLNVVVQVDGHPFCNASR